MFIIEGSLPKVTRSSQKQKWVRVTEDQILKLGHDEFYLRITKKYIFITSQKLFPQLENKINTFDIEICFSSVFLV